MIDAPVTRLPFDIARSRRTSSPACVGRLVAFVEDEHTVFLKTIIPSRKATKEYLGEESDHED